VNAAPLPEPVGPPARAGAPPLELTPLLSEAEQRAYSIAIADLLAKAERELTTAESRFPTVPQKQRIAQARGFISQAIAVRERDLAAAKSLAERAEILSRELAAEMR